MSAASEEDNGRATLVPQSPEDLEATEAENRALAAAEAAEAAAKVAIDSSPSSPSRKKGSPNKRKSWFVFDGQLFTGNKSGSASGSNSTSHSGDATAGRSTGGLSSPFATLTQG